MAQDPGGLVAAAIGMRRDLTWLLATYAVRPGLQGRGVARPLLEAAATHGAGCLRAMVTASDDPLALRRYRLAGFTLHPAMVLRGRVPRAVLPIVEHVGRARPTGSGYAYVAPGGGPHLLAATNRRTATDLLWETLADSDPEEEVALRHVTVANEWAVDVGMAARMLLASEGFLGLRGMQPPTPYVHSGSFL